MIVRGEQKGQALVETALVMPVVLAMVLGIFGFGRLFNAQLVITNASREGARLGALGQGDDEIRGAVSKYLSAAGLSSPQLAVAIAHPGTGSTREVSVAVTYPYQTVLALPGVPNPLPLTSSAVMRVEGN